MLIYRIEVRKPQRIMRPTQLAALRTGPESPSVCPPRTAASNSKTRRRGKPKIGANVPQGRSFQRVPIFTLDCQNSKVEVKVGVIGLRSVGGWLHNMSTLG